MLLKTTYKMKPPISARLRSGHPLADKLIACYLLNEGSGVVAHDSSGRDHHGTLTGGAAWTTGKFGRVIDLDGTDGHIDIAEINLSGQFTFVIWCKRNNTDDFDVIFGDSNANVKLQFGNNAIASGIRVVSGGAIDNSGLGLAATTWALVVLIRDGGDVVTMYRNQTSKVLFGGAAQTGNTTIDIIGKTNEPKYFEGLFDHVMIWERALTFYELTLLYGRPFCMFEQRRRVLVSVPA